MRRAPLGQVIALLSLTCAGPFSEIRAQNVRDSGGIRIVMNAKPTWTSAQQLRLSTAPTLVIGEGSDEAQLLTRVRGAFYLSDGRIVVADGGSNELRIFDGTGQHLKTFARRGDGPGEFRSIQQVIRLAGDTIAVLHDRASVSRFTSDGSYISRTNDRGATEFGRPGATMQSVTLAMNGGARVLLRAAVDPPTRGMGVEFDATAQLEVLNRNASGSRLMGDFPFMRASADKNGVSKPWLGAEAVLATDGAQFYYGYGTKYELTRYAAAGKPDLIVRRAWTAPKVSRREHEQFTDEWLSRWSKAKGAELAEERRTFLASDYFKVLPAFSALLLDRLGRLWARTPAAIDAAVAGSLNDYPMGPSSWSVFGANGVWLGDVKMPARFSPTDIGANYVLGIARDEDDVPTVVRFTLSAVARD